MDATAILTDETFSTLLKEEPLNVASALAQIRAADEPQRGARTLQLIKKLADIRDFNGLYSVVKDRQSALPDALRPAMIKDLFTKSCRSRTDKAFLAAADFGGKKPLAESFRRFELLSSIKPKMQVIDKSWGFGIVKRVDDFYSRIVIDFKDNPNHALSFETVCQTLSIAPEDHLFTIQHNDPARIEAMVAGGQGELVKLVLSSLGNMPVGRIESTLDALGIVPASKWKKFWEAARKDLKNDPLVEIPMRRAESLKLLAEAESYGDEWFNRLTDNRDPVDILKEIEELETTDRMTGLTDAERGVIEERLQFAVKGAFNTDPALYARLSCAVFRLGFTNPPLDQLREHLWSVERKSGKKRYILASEVISAHDVKSMTDFLLAEGGEVVARLLADIPVMPYNLVNDVLQALKDLPECEAACVEMLHHSKAPATLICWIFRFHDSIKEWKTMPSLVDMLSHAIALVESPLSGEDLRMQNHIKELFDKGEWLKQIFDLLNPAHRQLLFERVQASQAWDSSAHRTLLGKMLALDPRLAEYKKTVGKKSAPKVRLTSWRSMKARQLAYTKLIEVEIPKNSHDISVARSYGDLRENFEYQAAKDYQRQLMQRQTELQEDLKLVKGTDFADVKSDVAGSGTSVTLKYPDGTMTTYTILGEWDSDESLNIISNRTKIAVALEGKKAGDQAIVPSAEGSISVTIEKIAPLDEAVRAWIAATPEKDA